MQKSQNQLSSLLLQPQHQINQHPQQLFCTNNNVDAVICARCQNIPTDYICLSCGDNFCLQCMGVSVLRGEGEAVLVNGNQAISISCYACGQPTQLTPQATSAIDEFLQALDRKILLKNNLAFQQTQDDFLHKNRNITTNTTNQNPNDAPNYLSCMPESIQSGNIPLNQGFLFEQHLRRQQLEQQKQLEYLSEARFQGAQEEDYNYPMENDNNMNNISHCRQSTTESIQDSVQQQEMVVFPWSENTIAQQITTSQQFAQIPSAIASSSSSSSSSAASMQPMQQQMNFDTLGAQQIISNIQLTDQSSQQFQQNQMNPEPLHSQSQGTSKNLIRKIYSSKSSTAVCGNSNLSALNDRRKAIVAENSIKQYVVPEEEDVSVDEKLPSTHYTTTTNANSVSQLQLFINNNNNNNTNINNNNNMKHSQSQQQQRSQKEPCEVLMCEQHPQKQGILFCFECDSEPFCLDCLNEGLHKSHDVIFIEGNFHKLAGKMKETAHEIRASVEILKAQESRLQQMNQSCERDAQIVSSMIKQEIAEARESLRKKEVKLMEKTEQLLLERSAKIQGKLGTIETKTQALNELSNQFQLISSMEEPSFESEKMHLFKFYAQSKHILSQIPLDVSNSPSGSDKDKGLNNPNHNVSIQQNMKSLNEDAQRHIHTSPTEVIETASATKNSKNCSIKPKVDMFWTPHSSKESSSHFISPRQLQKTAERSSFFKEKKQQETYINNNQEMNYAKDERSPEEKGDKESFQFNKNQVKNVKSNNKTNIISNEFKKTQNQNNITSFQDNLGMTSTSTTPSSVASEIRNSFKKQPKPFEQSNYGQSIFFNKLFNPKKTQNNSQFATSSNYKDTRNFNILSSSSSFHHQTQHNPQDLSVFPTFASASSKSIQDVLFSNFKMSRQPPSMKTEESKLLPSPTKSYFDQIHHKPKWPILNKTTTLISSTQIPQKKYNFNAFHRSSTTTTHQHSQFSELSSLTDSESKLEGDLLKQHAQVTDNSEYLLPSTNPFDYPVSAGQSELSKQLRRIFESGKTTPADRRMTMATTNTSTSHRQHQQHESSHLKFQKQQQHQPNPLQSLQEQNTIFHSRKNKLFVQ